ncbi:MAG: hypothetical protein PHH54_00930 [Candidatus Nanoarchaeia archaeon]|nr:hypothetical protein [Candidatus Nanoarchaeia archaeon]MDD5740527.1 hypothetical protein [Candidatus Nanoarchaeia archaeon]
MKYILIAGIVIVIAFLAVLSFIPLGIEPLTELYIENHTSLPKNVFLDKTYNFSFSVHNLEYQDVEYNYTVNAYDVNDTLLFSIDSGSFTLANNETNTISENYVFDKKFKNFNRAKIEVVITKNLIGEPEFKRKLWWPDPNYPTSVDVHFWVDEIVPTTITIVRD